MEKVDPKQSRPMLAPALTTSFHQGRLVDVADVDLGRVSAQPGQDADGPQHDVAATLRVHVDRHVRLSLDAARGDEHALLAWKDGVAARAELADEARSDVRAVHALDHLAQQSLLDGVDRHRLHLGRLEGVPVVAGGAHDVHPQLRGQARATPAASRPRPMGSGR